jgi:membrane protein DedA with SNARE-associated domain/membrane-associated phospholipid phosphatase
MLHMNTLLALINHHPGVAYGMVFLLSLSESLAVIGLLVPGTVMMFGVGAVVATGSLGFMPVLFLAILGAIAGDGASYWLGHHYKERLKDTWPLSRYPEILKKGEAFFNRHGGKSVLFGRFVGPVRPVIPVVAGMLGMRPMEFGLVNVLSAIGWALVYILPGVLFGTSLTVAGMVSTRLAVVAFILVAAIWGFIWLSLKLMSLLERQGPALFSAFKQWATSDKPAGKAVRPVKQFFSFLLFRRQGEELLLVFLVLTLIVAGWGFLGVLQDVLAKDPLVAADQAVYHFFQSLRTSLGDKVFVALTELGDSFVNIALACTVFGVLLLWRCYRSAGFWIVTVVGGVLGTILLKWLIHLPRPVAIYHGASSYGFPSGHTTMSVIIYGFLAILIARGLAAHFRWRLFTSVTLIAFVIGISRLYLGAHWLSDVLGGLFIGTTWVALVGIAYVKGTVEKVPRRLLGFAVLIVIGLFGGWHITQRHKTDLSFYAPHHKVKTLPQSQWQADGWQGLPAWRIDMTGEREQPLILQWAGSTDDLARFLLGKGWKQPPSLTTKTFFGMFASATPFENMPVLPKIHDGRSDILRLAYKDGEIRFILRLWPSDILIGKDGPPLFIGTVERQQRRSIAGLINVASDSGEYNRSFNTIKQAFDNGLGLRRVQRRDYEIHIEHEQRHLHWAGEVLLVWEKAR